MTKDEYSVNIEKEDLGDRFQLWVKVDGLTLAICVSPHNYGVTAWRNRKKFKAPFKASNYSYLV